MPELSHHAGALKSARKRKDWSQSRLASALERAARVLKMEKDLPPGGRPTLVQSISYLKTAREKYLTGLNRSSAKRSRLQTKNSISLNVGTSGPRPTSGHPRCSPAVLRTDSDFVSSNGAGNQ